MSVTRPQLALFAVFFIYLVFAGSTPYSILMWQGYDDGLYMRLANFLHNGQWLGPYDRLTLVKGPAYPAFLALNGLTGIPLNLTEPALYFVACLLFATTVYRLRPSKPVFVAVFAATLLCPAIHLDRSRVYREFFFDSTLLIVFSLWFRVFFVERSRYHYLLAVAAGLAVGVFWLTREESIWIVPCLVVIVAYPLTTAFRAALKPTLLSLLIAVSATVAVKTAVGGMNYLHYGRFVVDELVDSKFQRALIAMQRVGATFEKPYVPVPKEARALIAAQSPMFNAMHPYMESVKVEAFCKITPESCGDISGGFFLWLLRDAAARQGAHVSAATAATYYEALAIEIEQACDTGRLPCIAWLPPLIPPITKDQWTKIPTSLQRSLALLFYEKSPHLRQPKSHLKPEGEAILQLLNYPLRIDEEGKFAASGPRQMIFSAWRQLLEWLVMPARIVFGLGSACLAVVALRSLRLRKDPLLWVAATLLGASAIRVALMILVNISSFPTMTYERFQSMHMMTAAVSVIAIYLAYGILAPMIRARYANATGARGP